ncbi:GTPase Era [bacterium]|nr:GTPase Era [bacterium]
MKFGSVALIGKSNVGKSTFINQVLGLKLSITSSKVQTTRNMIAGIYNDQDSQIVFYDTPGIYRTLNKMNIEMMKEARRSLMYSDLILYFINSYDRINDTDLKIIEAIKQSETPAFLVVNKIDLIEDENEFFERLDAFKQSFDFKERVAISALNNQNIKEIITDIKKYLNDGDPIYDKDLFTDRPVKFIVSEYIREKAINLTHEEIPHSITCVIDEYKEEGNLTRIIASIICDKKSQKPIIVGKGGNMIKEIGIEARRDIENLLSTKVYLELFVKVKEGWRDKEFLLKDYGLLKEDNNE